MDKEPLDLGIDEALQFVKSKVTGSPAEPAFKKWLEECLANLQATGRETWGVGFVVNRIRHLPLFDGRTVDSLQLNFCATPPLPAVVDEEAIDYASQCMVIYQCGLELNAGGAVISFIESVKASEVAADAQLAKDLIERIRQRK